MLLPNQDGLFLCLFILLGAVLATCLHEFGHAIVAYWGGDKTVKSKGYLTLNPLKYTDVSTSLVLPIVFLFMGGFALPGGAVYINTHLLRGRFWKSAVSAAGPGMTALTALVLSIPFWPDLSAYYSESWLWPALAFLAQIEVAVLILNLLPIPALDGYGILEPWLPEKMQQQLRGVKKYGFLFLLAMFWTSPALSGWFWGVSLAIADWLGIPQDLAAEGYNRFSDYRWLLLLLLIGVAVLHKKSNKSQASLEQEQQNLQKESQENQTLLAKQPRNYEFLAEQGAVLLRLEHYQEALEHYDRALVFYPQDFYFRLHRGLALALQGQFEAAVIDYEKALDKRPRDYDALHYKADALLELDRYEEALALFDRILMHSPQYSHVWHDRGVILQRLGRDEDAVICHEKAAYYDYKNELYWGALVELQQRLGQIKASDKSLRKGLKENPKSEHLWQIKLLRCLNENRYDDFSQACERFEAKTKGQSSLPIAFKAIGLGHMQRYPEALSTFEQALERKSYEPWVRANRANCWIGMKCYNKALAELDILISNKGEQLSLSLEFKAHCLIEIHRYDDAIAIYDQLLDNEDLDTEEKARYLVNRGFALRKQGHCQLALSLFDEALEMLSENVHALSNRGAVLVQLGQVKAGLAELDRSVFLKPENPLGWQTRGDSLRELGQYQRALESYSQALSIKPDIEILCDQAICFLGLEDPDSATQALHKAQDLHDPTTMRTIAKKPELATFAQGYFANGSSK